MLVLSGLGEILSGGIAPIILVIDCIIYSLISAVYKIFMALASARLLTSDAYTDIANNLYMIIGVVMLFVLAYAIIRAIIDPEQFSKGEWSGAAMVKRVIIAVLGLALAPTIFNVLYQAQGLFVEHDVISRIFFRDTDAVASADGQSVSYNQYVKEIGGAVTAVSIWQAMFHPVEGYSADDLTVKGSDMVGSGVSKIVLGSIGAVAVSGATIAGALASAGVITGTAAKVAGVVGTVFGGPIGGLIAGASVLAIVAGIGAIAAGNDFISQYGDTEITLTAAYEYASSGGSFDVFIPFLDYYTCSNDDYCDDGDKKLDYYMVVSTACGLFALYAFASFSFDMGIRSAKLAYLQIIAPIPLILQILPKFKGSFDAYIKSLTSTFMEVFIRISVVYIVIYVICHLSFDGVLENANLNWLEYLIAMALLIMGLIAFAKQAPKFITETLHLDTGNMSLGIRKKLDEGGFNAMAGTAISGVQRGATGIKDSLRHSKELGRGKWNAGLRAAVSGIGNTFAGAGRAIQAQTIGINGQGPVHSKNLHDAMDLSRRINDDAAQKRQEAYDAMDDFNAKIDAQEKAKDARDAANAKLSAAKAARDAAEINGASDAERARLDKNVNDARAEQAAAQVAYERANQAVADAAKNVTVAGKIEDAGVKLDAWTTGKISLDREEKTIEFLNAYDSLKGNLREEAYKKDNVTKTLKQAYDAKAAESVSEYRAGWDDRKYTDILNERLHNDANFVAAQTRYSAARDNYENAKANNANEATLRNLENIVIDSEKNLSDARNVVSQKLDYEAKRSDDEMLKARVELQKETQALKDAYESAADAFVFEKSKEVNSNTHRDIQSFLSKYADFLEQNGNMTINYGDAEHPINITVSELVTGTLGVNAASKSHEFKPGEVSGEGIFTIYDKVKTAGGEDIHENEVRYKPTSDGKSYEIENGPDRGKTISAEDFFGKVVHDAKKNGRTVDSMSGISQASDRAKKGSINLNNSIAPKRAKQRKQQEANKH